MRREGFSTSIGAPARTGSLHALPGIMNKNELKTLEALTQENESLRNFTTPHGDLEGEPPHRRSSSPPPPQEAPLRRKKKTS